MYFEVRYSDEYGSCDHKHRTYRGACRCEAKEWSADGRSVSSRGFHATIHFVGTSGTYHVGDFSSERGTLGMMAVSRHDLTEEEIAFLKGAGVQIEFQDSYCG